MSGLPSGPPPPPPPEPWQRSLEEAERLLPSVRAEVERAWAVASANVGWTWLGVGMALFALQLNNALAFSHASDPIGLFAFLAPSVAFVALGILFLAAPRPIHRFQEANRSWLLRKVRRRPVPDSRLAELLGSLSDANTEIRRVRGSQSGHVIVLGAILALTLLVAAGDLATLLREGGTTASRFGVLLALVTVLASAGVGVVFAIQLRRRSPTRDSARRLAELEGNIARVQARFWGRY